MWPRRIAGSSTRTGSANGSYGSSIGYGQNQLGARHSELDQYWSCAAGSPSLTFVLRAGRSKEVSRTGSVTLAAAPPGHPGEPAGQAETSASFEHRESIMSAHL